MNKLAAKEALKNIGTGIMIVTIFVFAASVYIYLTKFLQETFGPWAVGALFAVTIFLGLFLAAYQAALDKIEDKND